MFDECHDRLWEPQARECRASVDIWAQAILVRAILGPHSYQAPARTEASHGVARCNQQVCLSWGRQQPYKQQNRESAEPRKRCRTKRQRNLSLRNENSRSSGRSTSWHIFVYASMAISTVASANASEIVNTSVSDSSHVSDASTAGVNDQPHAGHGVWNPDVQNSEIARRRNAWTTYN